MYLLYFREKGDNVSGEYVVFTDDAYAPKQFAKDHVLDGYALTAILDMDTGIWKMGRASMLPTEEPLHKD